MKNILGIIISTLVFIILIFVSVYIHLKANESHKKISVNTFEEKIKNQETFIVYIKNTKNSGNEKMEEITKVTLEENKVESYYIDIRDYSEKDFNKLIYLINIENTPTIAFFKDGKEVKDSRIDEFENEKIYKSQLIYNLRNDNYIK